MADVSAPIARIGALVLRRRARDVRRTMAIAAVCAMAPVLAHADMPLSSRWVALLPFVIPAACALDWCLLWARLRAGIYGDNEMEAREAVEALLAERRRGGERDA